MSLRAALGATLCAALLASVWGARPEPKRFATVASGRLYRSGGVSPAQLAYLRDAYGIRTVLSMLNPEAPESIAEREAAERLGLRWLNVPLRGNGASEPQQREQVREIVLDESLAPLLVHCAAGVNRTGLAVGMYRLHACDWSADQVRREMLAFDFEDLDKHENLRAALREEHERIVRAAQPAAHEQPAKGE